MKKLILWIPKSDFKSPALYYTAIIIDTFFIFLPDTACRDTRYTPGGIAKAAAYRRPCRRNTQFDRIGNFVFYGTGA